MPSDPGGPLSDSDEPRPPGRPRKYARRTSTAIRLAPELHAQLSAAAEERDVSVNWLVNRAVERFLDRLIPVADWKLTTDE